MEQVDLKQFVFNACSYLNINIQSKDSIIYDVTIPTELEKEFISKHMKITFHFMKDKDFEYIHMQSYFIKKISKLILERTAAVSVITQYVRLNQNDIEQKYSSKMIQKLPIEYESDDYLLAWCKITIRGNHVEEYLNTFRYSFTTGEVDDMKYRSINSLTNAEESSEISYSIEDIKEALDVIYFTAKNKSHEIIKQRQLENDDLLQKEIDRINNYYFLILSEIENKNEDLEDEDYDNIDNLKLEKEHLIEQQNLKYNINLNDVSIETTSLIIFQKKYEKQPIIINDNGVEKKILIVSNIKK